MPAQTDIVIIGGGPAGTAAALAAAARGMQVVLVERQRRSARHLALRVLADELVGRPLSRAPASRVAEGFRAAVRRAGEAASAILDRRSRRLTRPGLARLSGKARLGEGRGRVVIDAGEGRDETLETEHVVLATGARAHAPAGCRVEGEVLTEPAALLEAARPPESALVVGGERDGVELAGLLATAGCRVTLVEAGPRVLPRADADVASAVSRSLEAAGATVLVGHRPTALEAAAGGACATIVPTDDGTGDGEPVRAETTVAHALTGREPDLAGLGLSRAVLDGDTPPAWIRLAGSAAGRGESAEAAWREGRAVIADIAGEPETVPAGALPWTVAGAGGCGWVGASEDAARRSGHSLLVGEAPIPGRGRVAPGFLKLVADRSSERVLGVHVAGPLGREAVLLAAGLIELGASRRDVADMAFPAGSPAEALAEAADEAEAR